MDYFFLSLGILLIVFSFWLRLLCNGTTHSIPLYHIRSRADSQVSFNSSSPSLHKFLIERAVQYDGEVVLPKKVYIGDSQNVSVGLKQKPEVLSMIEEAFSVREKEEEKSVTLQVYQHAAQEKFLEIELQAAAFSVDGGKIQQQLLNWMNAENLSYRWNCHFPNSGKHAIALIFRVTCSSDTYELGAIHHTIKVVQFDHLTHRQVQIITSITYVAGFIATVFTIVMNIPTLLHIFGLH